MIDDGTGLRTIGELARVTGLTVRTIRYWSDQGALPPVARSAGGYRLYDAASVARLELIRTLRELGLGLADVHRVLSGETTVAQVAAAHVVALDAQIRSLKVTRAVLSTVAKRGSDAEEMTLVNRLARLSAAERRRIVEDFVDEVFHGLDTADPVVRERMRSTAADLPEEPTPEQVDAWLELAEMLRDLDFRAEMRKVAEFNAADRGPDAAAGASVWFSRRLVQLGADAVERGIDPGSPDAAEVLSRLLGDADPATVLTRLRSHATHRVARYRELLAVVKGGGPEAAYRAEFAWVVAALEARTAG
ncbi:MerR family transcriptional regulator [Streptomyces sp. NPDC029044]|uniref:helix-turn-helix domain-containing protein n=1 Tax=Streptomyces sp. NPDC029044 TaxID=3157198 RepID=UPI0033DF6B04